MVTLHISDGANDLELGHCEAINLARRSLQCAGGDPNVLGYAALALGYRRFDRPHRQSAGPLCFARGWAPRAGLRVWAGQSQLALSDFATAPQLSPRSKRPVG